MQSSQQLGALRTSDTFVEAMMHAANAFLAENDLCRGTNALGGGRTRADNGENGADGCLHIDGIVVINGKSAGRR
jgi:hypothetical protein